jgi:NTP pyrophosphatase (non-canonical NTP hydrolase)
MEAVEADRKGKRFNKDAKETYELIQNVKFCKVIYKNYIKGSVEEELADAVIRLLDLSGLRNIHLELVTKDIGDSIDEIAEYYKDDTFTEAIYHISTLPVIYAGLCGYNTAINETILSIFGLAKHLDIDLIWHVEQKMCYNELRESKHGKKY